ncbi:MAG: FtsX-like permease family protein [Motilibacteraceae bacterium]
MSRFPGLPAPSGWRPALRIARRDALRARGRSLLVLLMVALPVLGMTVADVVARTSQLDPAEQVSHLLGHAQALVRFTGGQVMQSPDASSSSSQWSGDLSVPDPAAQVRQAKALLGAGYRVVTLSRQPSLPVATRAGRATMDYQEIAYDDPALAGHFAPLAGRAPAAADEVAVTRAVLGRTGSELGGTLRMPGPERTVRIVGVVGGPGVHSGHDLSIVGWPGALPGTTQEGFFLADGPPVSWPQVLRLNDHGFTVLSAAVLLDPPPDSEVPYYTGGGAAGRGNDLLFAAMVGVTAVVLATLEVVLLAGAAFAVGARRQARALGLLTATGGSPADVRRVVLAGGVVLGLAGGVLGVVAGVGLAAVAVDVLVPRVGADVGHFDIRPLELLVIAAVGLLTGVLAAVLPARSAARQDPVAALTGRRGQLRTPRRIPLIGVLLLAAGVAAAAAGSALAVASATSVSPTAGGRSWLVAGLIAGGAAVVQVGIVVCSASIVGLAGRLGRFLPLAPRLALRDASRHRGRSAPAVAAVSAAVAGSVAVGLFVAAQSDADRRQYRPSWPVGTAGVEIANGDDTESSPPGAAQKIEQILNAHLPVTAAFVLRTTVDCAGPACTGTTPTVPPENACPLAEVPPGAPAPSAAEVRRLQRTDWRCEGPGLLLGGTSRGTLVAEPDVARLFLGRLTPEAERVLTAGGVVVADRLLVAGGRAAFQHHGGDGTTSPVVRVPATLVPGGDAVVQVVESPGAARRLGQQVVLDGVLVRLSRPPTADEEDATRQGLTEAGFDAGYFRVGRPYQDDYRLGLLALVIGAGIITLGASGIATGLAQADARADHATLAAVGAAPRLRRRLAGAEALTVAGLGTVLGIASGFVPAVALIAAINRFRLVWPWTTLAEILVGIPLLAGATAWLFTRSRVPLERRLAD